MTSMRRMIRGFTLIEMLIVMVIIGFSISVIALSIGKDKDEEATRKEAQILMQAIDFVGEQTVLNNQIIAMFVRPITSEDGSGSKQWCYSWKRFRENTWDKLPEDTLPEHCMPQNMQWDMVIEARPYVYDPDLDPQPPVLFFAPSGETTAVEMAIFEKGSDIEAQRIELDLMGNAHWRNQEKELEQEGKRNVR